LVPDELQVRADPQVSIPDGPLLFLALQEQLGLKLEARKVPVEVLVVDHADLLYRRVSMAFAGSANRSRITKVCRVVCKFIEASTRTFQCMADSNDCPEESVEKPKADAIEEQNGSPFADTPLH
jgi:hypothetical protein